MLAKRGNSPSATFMRKVAEWLRYAATRRRVSGASRVGSSNLPSSSCGCRFPATDRALILRPLAVITPQARPASTQISRTGAAVSISAPRARAKAAIAWVIAPMPPLACPQAPTRPFTSPNAWCSST